jgi:hypothetical protein
MSTDGIRDDTGACLGCGSLIGFHKTGCAFSFGEHRETIEDGEIVLRLDPSEAYAVADAFGPGDLCSRRLNILADHLEASRG